ncbi:trypsin-like [Vanessa cardui]|uniref:trypsin-like n=1 Tax=Vanessa cardui TaxID=171605 RepID=UPI001F13C935|nr:trypsin-like [Vanessa cardui]
MKYGVYYLLFVLFLINFAQRCNCVHAKKSVEDNRDDDISDEIKEESLEIAGEAEVSNVTSCTRRKNSQMHEITKANENQFPFMVAIMSPRNEYVCAGSLISNGLILTTAQCTESISYVLINTTSDRKNNNTISLHIIKNEKFPTYTGIHSVKDVAVIYTEKHNNTIASKINVSNYTSTNTLGGIEALGFGLNADVGHVRELQYVGVDVRDVSGDKIKGYIDCIDTKVNTCFRDKGGPLIFNNELIGLVTTGQHECTNEIFSTYSINKRLVEALPAFTFKAWLDEKIAKNSEQAEEVLEVYPKKPITRKSSIHVMTSGAELKKSSVMSIFMLLCLNLD